MKFINLKEEEYEQFWENHIQKSFLSSPKIGELRKINGWEIYYVGIKDKDKLVAAGMIVSHLRKFGAKEFYSPRGLLVDYNNPKYLEFFIKSIKKFVKTKKGYIFRMDPYIINKQRDINGDIVEDGIDNSHVIQKLKSLGFIKVKENNMEQVGWMFSLNINGKTENEIFNEMKPNTRNIIRKASKFGIMIRELKYEELDVFKKIMIDTGKRRNFSIRNIEYYQNMYKLLHDKNQIKYLVTEINLKKYIQILTKEREKKINNLHKLNDVKYNDGKRIGLNNEIKSLDKRINESKDIIDKVGKDTIILSGSMFVMIKPEIIYLSSGNYEEYMIFNSQYLIQWEMIKYAINQGFKKYNFYGIPSNINNKPKDYGIYVFKKGFNGYVEELIGEYELSTSWKYYLFKLISKIKR